jgi:ankyrin repeat protein
VTEAEDNGPGIDFTQQTKRMLMSVLLCNLVSEGNISKVREVLISLDDLSSLHDYDFRTPLHIAAVKDQADIALLLINRGAKVNA